MVIKFQEKTAPISNGNYVSGAKSSIGSPTFCRDVNDEKSLSKLSAHSDSFSVPYTSSRTPFIGNECIDSGIDILAQKKKSVKFMMDSCDTQKIHCLTYTTNVILTSNDRKERWYTSAEIKRMRTDTYNEALAARSNVLPYLQQFQNLLSFCKESSSDMTERKHVAHVVAASQYRGLESLTFVETIRLNQRRTLQEILAAQEDFRDLLTPEELMRELQALSMKLTNCSSRLAYMLGVGDADEALHFAASQGTNCASLLTTQSEQRNQVNIRRAGGSPRAFEECIDSSRYEI
jgi:hypothetical protein